LRHARSRIEAAQLAASFVTRTVGAMRRNKQPGSIRAFEFHPLRRALLDDYLWLLSVKAK